MFSVVLLLSLEVWYLIVLFPDILPSFFLCNIVLSAHFIFGNHTTEDESAGCLTFIVFL